MCGSSLDPDPSQGDPGLVERVRGDVRVQGLGGALRSSRGFGWFPCCRRSPEIHTLRFRRPPEAQSFCYQGPPSGPP